MNKLTKPSLVRKAKLSEEHYLQSLMQQAVEAGLLVAEDIQRIQMQAVKLLEKQILRFTSGDSSSVTVEKAQSLMLSVFYCIGIYLKSLPDIDMSIAELKHKAVEELFEDGLLLNKSMVCRARELYELVLQSRTITNNQAYNDTLDIGIPPFFSSYDSEFSAHDSAAFIDYPLSNDSMELVGVEYICSYLEKLNLENLFCRSFSSERIHRLLAGYSRNHKELLINIFDIVMMNAIGCIICNKNPLLLNLTPKDCDYLQSRFQMISKQELDQLLVEDARALFKQVDKLDELILEYIETAVINSTTQIINAAKNNVLKTIFISFEEEDKEMQLEYIDGKRMEDDKFKKLTEEIRECRFITDKIKMLQSYVTNIEDLVDIFNCSCIDRNEYDEIFRILDEKELALLLKTITSVAGDIVFEAIETEVEWEIKLLQYLDSIASDYKKQIIDLHVAIRISE